MSIAEGAVAPPRAAPALCAHCGLAVPPGLVDARARRDSSAATAAAPCTR